MQDLLFLFDKYRGGDRARRKFQRIIYDNSFNFIGVLVHTHTHAVYKLVSFGRLDLIIIIFINFLPLWIICPHFHSNVSTFHMNTHTHTLKLVITNSEKKPHAKCSGNNSRAIIFLLLFLVMLKALNQFSIFFGFWNFFSKITTQYNVMTQATRWINTWLFNIDWNGVAMPKSTTYSTDVLKSIHNIQGRVHVDYIFVQWSIYDCHAL